MKETLGITELRTWEESRDLFASCNSVEHWATMNSCSFLYSKKGTGKGIGGGEKTRSWLSGGVCVGREPPVRRLGRSWFSGGVCVRGEPRVRKVGRSWLSGGVRASCEEAGMELSLRWGLCVGRASCEEARI